MPRSRDCYARTLLLWLRRHDYRMMTLTYHGSLPRLAPRAVETRGVRPDLLVVGSRGDGGMKRMLTGSTSASIVAAVDVPICVVRVPIFVQDAPPFRLPTPAGAELAAPLPRSDRSRQARRFVDD